MYNKGVSLFFHAYIRKILYVIAYSDQCDFLLMLTPFGLCSNPIN